MNSSACPLPLGVVQAIFEGSQGWINGLLFVVLSERGLRFLSWLCVYFKHCCCPLYIGPCCSCYVCRRRQRNIDQVIYQSNSFEYEQT